MAMIMIGSCVGTAWIALSNVHRAESQGEFQKSHANDTVEAGKESDQSSQLDQDRTTGDGKSVSPWPERILTARLQAHRELQPEPPPVVAQPEIVPPPVVSETQPIPVPLELTGTLVEDGHRFAVFRETGGRSFVVKEGMTVPSPHEAIRVDAVSPDSVTITFAGITRTLPLKKSANDSRP